MMSDGEYVSSAQEIHITLRPLLLHSHEVSHNTCTIMLKTFLHVVMKYWHLKSEQKITSIDVHNIVSIFMLANYGKSLKCAFHMQ